MSLERPLDRLMDRPLDGKTALITGGGGGIGSAISRRLARAGAQVVITYRENVAAAEAAVASLEGDGHQAFAARVDDSDSLRDLAAWVERDYGALDLLVNNAGVTTPVAHDDLDGLTDEWIDEIFRVNWRGAFAAVRAFKPLLLQATGGALIVNISSVAGQIGIGSNVAYCASKAALDSMTRSLARALAPHIRVVSVSPGWVDGDYARRMPAEIMQAQADKTPLGRIANADEVGEAVYAAAVHLPFTTGSILPVDGGRPLGV